MTALKALREFYNRIGDEFVILLPETIPFLAEVLEGTCRRAGIPCKWASALTLRATCYEIV